MGHFKENVTYGTEKVDQAQFHCQGLVNANKSQFKDRKCLFNLSPDRLEKQSLRFQAVKEIYSMKVTQLTQNRPIRDKNVPYETGYSLNNKR